VKDTIFLISKLMGLNEVVVFGHGKGEDKLKELKKQLLINKTEMQLAAADPSVGVNLLGLIQKLFKRRKESKKERFRRLLEEY
jgi:imidazoleglycerol phosphate synthase glutamine amidotransferase subunit HisH